MVIDTECLAWGATDQTIQIAYLQSCGVKEIPNRYVFDWPTQKLRAVMRRLKCLARVLVKVIAGQDRESSLPETL